MKPFFLLFVLLHLLLAGCAQKTDPNQQWFMFRGSYASGILDHASLPETWDVQTGENIAWKTEIPGLGHSSPIIWGENMYVTSALNKEHNSEVVAGIYGSIESAGDSTEHEWILYCIDKNTGEIKWQQTAHTGIPKQKRHPMSSHANSTPATNGDYVVAFFGSEGYDLYPIYSGLILLSGIIVICTKMLLEEINSLREKEDGKVSNE